MKLIAVAVVVLVAVQGCALHDRRDAAWDPRRPGALFEQIPAWDRTDTQCGDYSNGGVPRC